jgi:hypothetical protein
VVLQRFPALLEIGADLVADPFDQSFALDDGQIGYGRSAAGRMAGIGVAMEELDRLVAASLRDLVGCTSTPPIGR